jgi:transcription elongation factor Elf1
MAAPRKRTYVNCPNCNAEISVTKSSKDNVVCPDCDTIIALSVLHDGRRLPPPVDGSKFDIIG